MQTMRNITDKVAISLSLLCTFHCLVLPLIAVLLPSVAALSLEEEVFKLWMLAAVVPISVYALTMGCQKHQRYRLLSVGGVGLSILCATTFSGHEMLGEIWEKTLTVIGAAIIALGHFWNYRLCRHQANCQCREYDEKAPL